MPAERRGRRPWNDAERERWLKRAASRIAISERARLCLRELGAITGYNPEHLRRLAKSGLLPSLRSPGGKYTCTLADFARMKGEPPAPGG